MSLRTHKPHAAKGFTTLLAVLVASLLLAIGFSLFDITYKQSVFSPIARNSYTSLYIADLGIECAQYWDTKYSTVVTPQFSLDSSTTWAITAALFRPAISTVPISLVQQGASVGHGSSRQVTLPSSIVSGDLIVVSVAASDPAGVPANISVNDSRGNTFTKTDFASSPAGTPSGSYIYYAPNSSAGNDTVTVSVPGFTGGSDISVSVADFSGADTGAPLDVHAASSGTSNKPIVSSGLQPSVSGEVAIASVSFDTSAAVSAGRGYQLIFSNNSIQPIAFEYKVLGTNSLFPSSDATTPLSPASGILCSGIDITTTHPPTADLVNYAPECNGVASNAWCVAQESNFATTTFRLNVSGTPYCAVVQVVKTDSPVRTSISSRGYTSCTPGDPGRIERGLQLSY